MPTSNQGLSDVIIGTILLNFSQSFLGDLSGKISNAGQGSIRKSLVNKLTHHVLSQDLEQCERNQRGGSRSRRSNRRRDLDPAKVLGHVKRAQKLGSLCRGNVKHTTGNIFSNY